MAFPHGQGLVPSEVAFLCEMELITVIPRQRLERLDLLGGPTNALNPPTRTTLPLWLALLLKRQKRANILPPPWLSLDSLRDILELETEHFQDSFSPPPTQSTSPQYQRDVKQVDYDGKQFYASTPFVSSQVAASQANALPYHWFEMGEMLLDAAADDLQDPDGIRGLLKDLREIRLAKMRKGVGVLGGEGEGVRLDGVGAMEVSESRGLITGVMDGLRKIGASREQARREKEQEERENGRYGGDEDEDEDDVMT